METKYSFLFLFPIRNGNKISIFIPSFQGPISYAEIKAQNILKSFYSEDCLSSQNQNHSVKPYLKISPTRVVPFSTIILSRNRFECLYTMDNPSLNRLSFWNT